MSSQKVDFSAAEKLIKAIEYSAQQCGAPLSAWITHCCCASVPRESLDGLPSRTTKPATKLTARITLEDIRQAGDRSVRKTISCPDSYSQEWSDTANICGQTVSSWVVNCCLPYLASEVRKLIPEFEQTNNDDRTSTLEYRLFHLYHVLDHSESKHCLWAEFEPENTHLFSHLPYMPDSLHKELEQLVDRMLVLAMTGDENPLGDGEVDTKIRFYFRASKRKVNRTDEEREEARNRLTEIRNIAATLKFGRRSSTNPGKTKPKEFKTNLFLFRNHRLRMDQKIERLRASIILQRLKTQAKAGMSVEQFLDQLREQDPFIQYIKGQFDSEPGTILEVLHNLNAYAYCDDLDYRLSQDSDDEE